MSEGSKCKDVSFSRFDLVQQLVDAEVARRPAAAGDSFAKTGIRILHCVGFLWIATEIRQGQSARAPRAHGRSATAFDMVPCVPEGAPYQCI